MLIAAFMIIGFCGYISVNAFAQDQDYYEEYEDENINTDEQEYIENDEFSDQYPDDQEYLEPQEYMDNEGENPDPEFMEQQEPGEYDQSDDTTELIN